MPRGTSIIVQRKPPSRGAGKGSAARYVTGNAIQISSRQEIKKPLSNVASSSVSVTKSMNSVPSLGTTEDEAIKKMLLASSDQWQETQDRMAMSRPVYRPGVKGVPSGPIPDRPLPQGYICYRCGQKGHYIQACPTNGDEAFENRKRIKRTTGIPRSQLQKVDKQVEDGDGNVMVNAEGESVMFVPDSASWEIYQKNTQTSRHDEVLEDSELACAICKKMMDRPVSVPCCKATFCEDCIQGALLESDFVCPICSTKDILLDQLLPEAELSSKIQSRIKSQQASGAELETLATQNISESATGSAKRTRDELELVSAKQDLAPDQQNAALTMPPFDPMLMGLMGFPPMGMGFPPMPMPMPMPMQMPLPMHMHMPMSNGMGMGSPVMPGIAGMPGYGFNSPNMQQTNSATSRANQQHTSQQKTSANQHQK